MLGGFCNDIEEEVVSMMRFARCSGRSVHMFCAGPWWHKCCAALGKM